MNIPCYIVDDELHNIENLSFLLQTHCPEIAVVGTASNVETALKGIQASKPALLFLDIKLHKETGFDLLQQLSNTEIEVVFVTAYDQFGIQAIKYAALDYLLKPINSDELAMAVKRAIEKIGTKKKNEQLRFLLEEINTQQPRRIALPHQQEIRYVDITSIIRCEASNNYTYIYLDSNEKILVAKTLKEYITLLPSNEFIRPHQSHLVNRNYIKSWIQDDGPKLLLLDKTKIPVSRLNRERIKQLLHRP